MTGHRLTPWILAVCALFLGVLALPWSGRASADDAAAPAPAADASVAEPPAAPRRPTAPLPPLGEMRLERESGRFVAAAGERKATLTIDPRLQEALTRKLAENRVPWGATVLLDPRTGRVLAMAGHSERERGAQDLPLRVMAPAASVFKVITAAALLERGVGPEETVCYHGGQHRIAKRNLADDPRRDRRCLTLTSAMGHSANVVFAKLADRGLTADGLRTEADRWLFNGAIPFARPVEPSRARIPEEPFELATTAAGFGEVRMSALHGALIAATVANGGLLVPPELVDAVDGGPAPLLADPRRVVDEPVARSLAAMMRTTTTEGTARKIFLRDRWSRRSPLREVAVAGKTGSLSDKKPFRNYSWFVGFAPVDDPQVAVATLIVNEAQWRVKASAVAHHALESYFANPPPRPAAAAEPPAPASRRVRVARVADPSRAAR